MAYHVPGKASIPDRIQIRGDLNSFKQDDAVFVKFASIKPTKRSDDILFTIRNKFMGPYMLCPIRSSSHSFNALLTIDNAFPLSQIIKKAVCMIPDWAINDLILSGYILNGGHMSRGIEMCAVTYGSHSTLILKDGEIYNKIINKV